MTHYDLCLVFKQFGGTLLEYYMHADSDYVPINSISHYAKARDVRLILLVRYERNGNGKKRTLCKIHCPINPLPVKGEFETPSLNTIRKFLERNGWEQTEIIPASLLK